MIEAKRRSGSLITARFAAEQGRPLFAAPAAPADPRGQGCNDLIRDGAILTQSGEDILQDLPLGTATPAPPPATGLRERPPTTRAADGDLDLARRFLIENLSPTPVPLDAVLRESQMPHELVLSAVAELEIAGRVLRHSGGSISLIPVA